MATCNVRVATPRQRGPQNAPRASGGISATEIFRRVLGVLLVSLSAPSLLHAEMRTWSDRTGQFKIEAALVWADERHVWLEREDGSERKVERVKLSAADATFVRDWLDTGGPKRTTDLPNRLAELEAQAQTCRTAKQALLVYQLYVKAPSTPEGARLWANQRTRYWEYSATKNLTRIGTRWCEPEAAKEARKQSVKLVLQGLELVRIGSYEMGAKKLQDASDIDPDGVQAEFVMAILNIAIGRMDLAERNLTECRRRSSKTVWIVNDLAICQTRLGKIEAAAQTWADVLKMAPDLADVVGNVYRFLSASNAVLNNPAMRRNKPLVRAIEALAEEYTLQVATGKFARPDESSPWVFMFPRDDEIQQGPSPAEPDDAALVSGSGFVVWPGYLITNAHVVVDAANVGIVDPEHGEKAPLPAKVVAMDKDRDLALLQCNAFQAPPLVVRSEPVRRGEEMMVLGYPMGSALGNSLKATRGSITSLPDAATDNMYLHDAVGNPGNSGGPICDARGSVIGVHSVGYNTAAKYGGAIPSSTVLDFLKKHLPSYIPRTPQGEKLEWTDVDALAGPSTVMIVATLRN